MLEFFKLNRGIRVLRARRFEPPAQRRRRGILHMRAGMPIVRPPIRDQLRLEHVVVSIIDDRVEYYRAKRKLLYPGPRQAGSGMSFREAAAQIRRRIGA